MIRHVVLCRSREDVSDEEMADVLTQIEALKDIVPGIVSTSSGRDHSPEGLHHGFTHGFTVDFVDAAARDRYLSDPDHRAAGARLVSVTDGGVDGLIVIDWNIA